MIPNISDSELRARIYREAMIDAENENIRLREENEKLKTENDKLCNINRRSNNHVAELEQQVISLMGHKARYQQEITDIEADYEKLFKTLQGLRNTLQRCSDDIYSAIMVD